MEVSTVMGVPPNYSWFIMENAIKHIFHGWFFEVAHSRKPPYFFMITLIRSARSFSCHQCQTPLLGSTRRGQKRSNQTSPGHQSRTWPWNIERENVAGKPPCFRGKFMAFWWRCSPEPISHFPRQRCGFQRQFLTIFLKQQWWNTHGFDPWRCRQKRGWAEVKTGWWFGWHQFYFPIWE